jgi:TolA-binding protein
MSNQIQSYLNCIAQLEEKHRQAGLNCEESAKRIDHLSRQRDELMQENQILIGTTREAIHSAQRTSASDAEVTKLRDQLASLQSAHQLKLRQKEDQIDRLNEKLQDRTLDQPLDNSLSTQIRELHSDMSRLRLDNDVLKQQSTQLMQDKLTLSRNLSALNQEKSALVTRISTLEKVRLADGVVVCVDLSTSLGATLVKIAKDAFRTITSGIRERNPMTHLGVIVQESSVWTARTLSQIDFAADGLIDAAPGGGSECYEAAIQNIADMMFSFWARYPRRATRVILIGDGNDVFGCPLHLLTPFQSHGTPIHNVVVQTGHIFSSSASSSKTAQISGRTNGLNFAYSGNSSTLLSDALLGQRNST